LLLTFNAQNAFPHEEQGEHVAGVFGGGIFKEALEIVQHDVVRRPVETPSVRVDERRLPPAEVILRGAGPGGSGIVFAEDLST
jgi:hypothetical protein